MREKLVISEEQLGACVQEHYDLTPVTVDFLPLGLDTRAAIYRIVDERGVPYLLKVKSGSLYEAGCLVPRYLFDQGITSVVAPLPTRSTALWARMGKWAVILYPFIDGDTSWTGMTDEQWRQVGSIFQRIHQVVLPARGFESLRKETFDPTEYVRWGRSFETQHAPLEGRSPSEGVLLTSWMTHQSTLHTVMASLETLAGVLQKRSGPHVICHADLHPANLLRDYANQVFVIDWDDVMLAPKERDFLFVKDAPSNGSSPFFQGYGPAEIDWIALTYYRYERVVQDVIECATDVFFRDDLGEETKAEAAELFRQVLAEDGEIAAAYAAAAHLPSDLAFMKNT